MSCNNETVSCDKETSHVKTCDKETDKSHVSLAWPTPYPKSAGEVGHARLVTCQHVTKENSHMTKELVT